MALRWRMKVGGLGIGSMLFFCVCVCVSRISSQTAVAELHDGLFLRTCKHGLLWNLYLNQSIGERSGLQAIDIDGKSGKLPR